MSDLYIRINSSEIISSASILLFFSPSLCISQYDLPSAWDIGLQYIFIKYLKKPVSKLSFYDARGSVLNPLYPLSHLSNMNLYRD